MQQLWKINQNLIEVFDEIYENEGELTPELEQKLNITRENTSDIFYQVDKMYKIASSECTIIEDEVKRLNAMLLQRAKFMDMIDKTIHPIVERFGVEDEKSKAKNKPKFIPFDLGKAVVSYTQAVDIDDFDIDTIPEELEHYAKVSVTIKGLPLDEAEELISEFDKNNVSTKVSISKDRIKEAIEEGCEFMFANIKINSNLKWK
jgi:hypothetical protein